MGIFNKQAPGDNPGYVYLIRRGPYYKIGHTSDTFWRMKTIRDVVTPCEARAFSAELVWSMACADQITTERALHQRLVGYYSGWGEWFILPDEMVAWVCQLTEVAAQEGYDPARYRRTDSRRYR